MKINDYNSICIIENASINELQILSNLLAVKADKPWMRKAYRDGKWDGLYRFVNKSTRSFPSGLLSYVKAKYPQIEIVQSRKPNCKILGEEEWKLPFTPRPEQLEAAKAALQHKRGIIEAPTGSGKTNILGIIAFAIRGNILVLIHTKDLLSQTRERLAEYLGEKIGIIGAGKCDIQRVTVATVQTLMSKSFTKVVPKYEKAVDFVKNLDCVIHDECHHASANTFYNFMLGTTAPYRIGFSADPLDQHKVKFDSLYKKFRIEGCFAPIIYRTTVRDMKTQGHVASPDIQVVKVPSSSNTSVSEDYLQEYCKNLCDNQHLEFIVGEIVKRHKTEQVLILFKHIHHGDNLSKYLNSKGVVHSLLHGETSINTITSAKKEFINSGLKVILASNIFTEGTDLPNIDVLINAAGDIAPTKQRIGRAMRKKQNKPNKVKIYDFYFEGSKMMIEHLKKRLIIYQKEGHNIL